MRSSYNAKEDEPSHVYYNITIPGVVGREIKGEYLENRATSIVNKAKDYECSIIRWSVPTLNIPIMVWPTLSANSHSPLYQVAMTYGNFASVHDVVYEPDNALEIPSLPITSENSAYYYVYSYSSILNMINTTFAKAYAELKNLTTLPVTTPPYFTYDDTSSNSPIKLHAEAGYLCPTTGQPDPDTVPLIYVNNSLFNLLAGLPHYNFDTEASPTNFSNVFLVKNNYTNEVKNIQTTINIVITATSTAISPQDGLATFSSNINGKAISGEGIPPGTMIAYINSTNATLSNAATQSGTITAIINTGLSGYDIDSEWNNLYLWYSFKTIIFTTSLIPIFSEQIGAVNTASSVSNYKQILSDFEPNIGNNPQDLRQTLIYNPTAEYRMVSLQGDAPVRSVDIQVYWQDHFFNSYPIFISPGDAINIKMLFRKKRS
jgi:hypothetical protein